MWCYPLLLNCQCSREELGRGRTANTAALGLRHLANGVQVPWIGRAVTQTEQTCCTITYNYNYMLGAVSESFADQRSDPCTRRYCCAALAFADSCKLLTLYKHLSTRGQGPPAAATNRQAPPAAQRLRLPLLPPLLFPNGDNFSSCNNAPLSHQ